MLRILKKHAFLVLVHDQPSQVAELVDSLTTPNTSVFLHVDQKSCHEFSALVPSGRMIRTQKILWGGFGMVQATLDLLRLAKACEPFSTYTLLSGSDFPIKPLDHILTVLNGTDFNRIDYWHDEDPSWHNRYKRYFFNDIAGWRGRLLNGLSRRLAKAIPARKFYENLTPYFGSQWWTLTDTGVNAVLCFVESNPRFLKYSRNVHIPDEMFFQTILLNVFGENSVLREPLRYLDWSEKKANPKILDISDEQFLLKSDALFARKFHPVLSSELMYSLKSVQRSI